MAKKDVVTIILFLSNIVMSLNLIIMKLLRVSLFLCYICLVCLIIWQRETSFGKEFRVSSEPYFVEVNHVTCYYHRVGWLPLSELIEYHSMCAIMDMAEIFDWSPQFSWPAY